MKLLRKVGKIEMTKSKSKKKRSSKTPVAITIEEYAEILKQTTGLHHRMGIMLAFESGLRISECIALKPENINLKERKNLWINIV